MLTATKPKTKLSVAELSALYDRIYDIADRLFKKYNPCNIHTKNGRLYCISHNEHWNPTHHLCCGGCIDNCTLYGGHWSKGGCTTKCLPCKLYLCDYAQGKNRQFFHQLHRLKQFAYKHGLPRDSYYYMSKEQWLKQM